MNVGGFSTCYTESRIRQCIFFQVSIKWTCFYHKLIVLHNSSRRCLWPLAVTFLPIGMTLFWTSPRNKEYASVSSKWDHRPLLNSKPDHLYKMNMSPTVYIMPDVLCSHMKSYTVLSPLRHYSRGTWSLDTWRFSYEFAMKQLLPSAYGGR